MSDAETRLAAFFREERPKASDAVFRLAVLERRAQRRFYLYTGWVIAGGALAAGCVMAVSPHIPAANISHPITGMVPLLSVVVTGACVLLAFGRARQTF